MAATQRQDDPERPTRLVRDEELEDVMALRVYTKARRQLTIWITFGGVVVFLAGFVGFTQLQSYTRSVVKKKVAKVADSEVRSTMRDEAQRRISLIAGQQRKVIERYTNQQINNLVSLAPITAAANPEGSTQAATSLRATTQTRLDYSAQMLPVRDSGGEGSVVGFAVASALEYQLRRHEHRSIRISPRYLYYYARKAGGIDVHTDGGANIKDAMSVLSEKGAVPEAAWRYEAGDFAGAPPAGIGDAKHYSARGRPLGGIDEIKAALQQYGPVVVGVTVYESFSSTATRETGTIPDPKPNESIVGGHAICVVGYDDAKHRFKFENSWGSGWGDKGYGYVSYDYVRKHGADAWSLSL
jgi:C1A family cysteine protease